MVDDREKKKPTEMKLNKKMHDSPVERGNERLVSS